MNRKQRILSLLGILVAAGMFVGAMFGSSAGMPGVGAIVGLIMSAPIAIIVSLITAARNTGIVILSLLAVTATLLVVSIFIGSSFDTTVEAVVIGVLGGTLLVYGFAPNIRFAHGSLCVHCGYDMRNLPHFRCPECGVDSRSKNHKSIMCTLVYDWKRTAAIVIAVFGITTWIIYHIVV